MDSTRVRGPVDIPAYLAASVTYSATAAATVVWEIANPTATIRGQQKVIRVHRVILSATQTTGSNIGDWRLEMSSTTSAGGTSASVTAVSVDSTQLAATAAVLNFTANPTAGTLIGIIWQPRVLLPAPGTILNPTVLDFDTTTLLSGRPITLRANQALRINFGGGTLPSGCANLQVSCYWTEEPVGGAANTAYRAQ